jgi:hypothetical protein
MPKATITTALRYKDQNGKLVTAKAGTRDLPKHAIDAARKIGVLDESSREPRKADEPESGDGDGA